jgi:hypothetical protein
MDEKILAYLLIHLQKEKIVDISNIFLIEKAELIGKSCIGYLFNENIPLCIAENDYKVDAYIDFQTFNVVKLKKDHHIVYFSLIYNKKNGELVKPIILYYEIDK